MLPRERRHAGRHGRTRARNAGGRAIDTISASQLTTLALTPDFANELPALARHAITIAVGGERLRVFFGDASWAAAFGERYADLRDDTPGPALGHYVARLEAGYVFATPDADAWLWTHGELRASAGAFLSDATALTSFFNASPDLMSFHAAAVGVTGAAAAITGDSTAGKTTTALACGRAGLSVYSDERCVLRGGIVVPFARTLNVRREGWMRLQTTSNEPIEIPAAAHTTPDGFTIRLSELFGAQDLNVESRLRLVFLLSGYADAARAEPVHWSVVAPALAKWMNVGERGLQRGARLIETLSRVDCFRLVLGSPQESAALVRSILCERART